MNNTDRKNLLLSEVEKYISDNETEFIGIEDQQAYLNFLFNLTQNISTDINIDVLEDWNELFWQATIYKGGYTIILTMLVLSINIESKEDFINYILELEEEANQITLINKNNSDILSEYLSDYDLDSIESKEEFEKEKKNLELFLNFIKNDFKILTK